MPLPDPSSKAESKVPVESTAKAGMDLHAHEGTDNTSGKAVEQFQSQLAHFQDRPVTDVQRALVGQSVQNDKSTGVGSVQSLKVQLADGSHVNGVRSGDTLLTQPSGQLTAERYRISADDKGGISLSLIKPDGSLDAPKDVVKVGAPMADQFKPIPTPRVEPIAQRAEGQRVVGETPSPKPATGRPEAPEPTHKVVSDPPAHKVVETPRPEAARPEPTRNAPDIHDGQSFYQQYKEGTPAQRAELARAFNNATPQEREQLGKGLQQAARADVPAHATKVIGDLTERVAAIREAKVKEPGESSAVKQAPHEADATAARAREAELAARNKLNSATPSLDAKARASETLELKGRVSENVVRPDAIGKGQR